MLLSTSNILVKKGSLTGLTLSLLHWGLTRSPRKTEHTEDKDEQHMQNCPLVRVGLPSSTSSR